MTARCRTKSRPVGALLAAALLVAAPGMAQGFGPRALQLVPENSTAVTAHGLFLDGNQSLEPGSVVLGSDISVDLAVVQITRAFRLPGGQQGAIIGVVPYGRIQSRFETALPGLPQVAVSRSGLFDPQLVLVLGLVGSPSLPLRAYATRKPGFALGALANVHVPIGSYSSDRLVNPGNNRWAVQLGLPLSRTFGPSVLAPDLATLELVPAVTVYGTNRDPFGKASRTGQQPLFTLEAHATRNLNRALVVSLDAFYANGGAQTRDGASKGNRQESLGIGGSVNLNLSPAFAIRLSHGSVIARNAYGADGQLWRVSANRLF